MTETTALHESLDRANEHYTVVNNRFEDPNESNKNHILNGGDRTLCRRVEASQTRKCPLVRLALALSDDSGDWCKMCADLYRKQLGVE